MNALKKKKKEEIILFFWQGYIFVNKLSCFFVSAINWVEHDWHVAFKHAAQVVFGVLGSGLGSDGYDILD